MLPLRPHLGSLAASLQLAPQLSLCDTTASSPGEQWPHPKAVARRIHLHYMALTRVGLDSGLAEVHDVVANAAMVEPRRRSSPRTSRTLPPT